MSLMSNNIDNCVEEKNNEINIKSFCPKNLLDISSKESPHPEDGLSLSLKRSHLDRLKEHCSQIIINFEKKNKLLKEKLQYVYKTCSRCIVIMKFLSDTRTNEKRKNVANPLYAKFRADKLFVVAIINIHDFYNFATTLNNNYDIKTKYEVGQIVRPNFFDENIDKICSHGIHYFKTIDAAYYYNDVPSGFTGIWCRYYDSGNKESETDCRYGLRNGKKFCWYESGNKQYEGDFIDGDIKKSISWYENGNKSEEIEYNNSYMVNGKSISYYENGNKRYETEYINNIKNGKSIEYYENENKCEEGEYIDGKKSGKWIRWNIDGNKIIEEEYFNGSIYALIDYKKYASNNVILAKLE